MGEHTRFVGLDVHKETITVAVAEREGVARLVGTIVHNPVAVAKLVRKLGPVGELRVCYEAGPCGYALQRQLASLGVFCEVVAPALIPVRPGDRVKTDRRDAQRLATLLRSGELTAVWVPDEAHEALRDLVRAREAAQKDLLRARHRLGKLLLRQGQHSPRGTRAGTQKYMSWVRSLALSQAAQEVVRLDYLAEVDRLVERVARLNAEIVVAVEQLPAEVQRVVHGLQVLRGVALVSAVTAVAEVGQFSRFSTPRQLMAYSGLVPRERSSATAIRRGGITKTGNAHLRRVVVEAAWHYRHAPFIRPQLKRRQVGQPASICATSFKAQQRLHMRYRRLLGRGKNMQQTMTAIARELLGFMWAIAINLESTAGTRAA